MVKVICDGAQIHGAEVTAGELPLPWLLELEYAHDLFGQRPGRMRVDYLGWQAFLSEHGCGLYDPLFFLVQAPNRAPTALLLRVKNFSPLGDLTFTSQVQPPPPR